VNKLFFSIILLVALSCSKERVPNSVMSKDEMINYLIDLHISEAAVQNLRLKADSARIVFSIQEKFILNEHKIADSTFIKSYNFYLGRPSMLEEIYSAVVDSISLRQSLLNEDK